MFPNLFINLIIFVGIYEATSLERGRKDSFQKPDDPSNGLLGDEIQMSALPTWSKFYFLITWSYYIPLIIQVFHN